MVNESALSPSEDGSEPASGVYKFSNPAPEPVETQAPSWSEPKYPTEEEIEALPDYIHPATRWSLACIALVAGCVAAGLSVMRILGDEFIPPLVPRGPDAQGQAAAWIGLISGLCWMMAGITISRGRMTGTGIWFLLGLLTGLIGTFL
ncbi:MAG: hypothetical protein KF861_14080 [Planctomycetaceae bacterium]|nr:hypothetical protein [Planctomycetaceae bacterium]